MHPDNLLYLLRQRVDTSVPEVRTVPSTDGEKQKFDDMTEEQRKQKMRAAIEELNIAKQRRSLRPTKRLTQLERSLRGHPVARPQTLEKINEESESYQDFQNQYMYDELHPKTLQGIVDLFSNHRDFGLQRYWRRWESNLQEFLESQGYQRIQFWTSLREMENAPSAQADQRRANQFSDTPRWRHICAKYPVLLGCYRVEFAKYRIPTRKAGRKSDHL